MFEFSNSSLSELEGVHPDLVDLAHEALRISNVDFAVHDGIRSMEEQREYVEQGVSHTMDSRHLSQADGYGHALDLVPYVNGRLRWEWGPIYRVAQSVRAVAVDRDLIIRWGGVWDRDLNDLGENLEVEVEAYGKRRRSKGQRVFLDGPHFELVT